MTNERQLVVKPSNDGRLYGLSAGGSANTIAVGLVSTAQRTTQQTDIDAAAIAVDALPTSAGKTILESRLAAFSAPTRLTAATVDAAITTPYVSSDGMSVRAPGRDVHAVSNAPLVQSSGWSCVHTKTSLRHFRMLVAIGVEADALLANDGGGTTTTFLTCNDSVYHNGSNVWNGDASDAVIAVNYQTNPIIYVIVGGVVVYSVTLSTVTGPINLVLRPDNYSDKTGWGISCNFGGDVLNCPMPSGIYEALDTAGAANLGSFSDTWGPVSGSPARGKPTLAITSDAPVSPAVGVPITVTCSAVDGYGQDMTEHVEWYNETMNWHDPDAFGSGSSYTYTPSTIGFYVVRAEWRDSAGTIYTDTLSVLVDGTPVQAPTAWDPALTNPSIAEISGDLVRFGPGAGFKHATQTNNAIWAEFRYYEITVIAPDGQVAAGGMGADNAPTGWSGTDDGNTTQEGNGGWSVVTGESPSNLQYWINGSSAEAFSLLYIPNGVSDFIRNGGVIGFAVDATDKEDFPLVYVIAGDNNNGGAGRIFDAFRLPTLKPIHAMGYVNSNPVTAGGQYDMQVNGGARPFTYDADALLAVLMSGSPVPNYATFKNGLTTAEER